jgi:hypothetical protein
MYIMPNYAGTIPIVSSPDNDFAYDTLKALPISKYERAPQMERIPRAKWAAQASIG